MTYYPNGAIAGFTYGNGIVHSLTQNARGLPRISKDANGATAILQDEYAYDAVGNVLAITDAATGQSQRGNRDMTYDALNRLTRVTGEAGAPSPMFGVASYTYDDVDNLVHVQVTGGSKPRNQDYVYDSHNRLTNIVAGGESVIGLGYDVQGNLANRNGTTHTFTFDYGNRLRAGELETYRYDVQGRRIRSSSSAGLVYSLYAQSGQLLFQRDERSGKRRQYIYLGGSLVAESDMPLTGSTATVTYQHTDALGSPVATTNSAKTVLQRSEYEPYGYLLNRPMEDGPGYTGHVTDAATGLVYMQQRYCDPMIGRCLSVDPVTAYDSGDMRLFNRYAYAFNNPYKFTDPDGRNGVTAFGGLLTETWNAINGRGFNGSMVLGALRDGYDGQGAGVRASALQDATSFIPVGKPLQLLGGAVKAVEVGIQANRVAGKAAEALAAKELVAEGNTILGSQVGARTSDGLRVIDHLIKNPAGDMVAVEVKAGNGARNAAQLAKDGKMATEGAVLVGKNVPAELRGQRVIIETIERRYPSK